MKEHFHKNIEFNKGRLIPMHASHTQDVVRWRNDPSIAKWFFTQRAFTVDGHNTWLSKARTSELDFNWIIQDEHFRSVGAVGLYNIDRVNGRAEIGRIFIGEAAARRRGFARKAFAAVLESARTAHLREIYLIVLSENAAAISLYKSINFETTAVNGDTTVMTYQLNHG